ncbi:MAG TPA: MBL fold metallo-hydrolase [Vicinamibacterales bacterium]|jgi:glyoxylase-like metal-dependent hydrolase (beta-lactamase superfamily II)|nr:MBL fold metallo-hydrolase [Vicinamibacterales bacterium]
MKRAALLALFLSGLTIALAGQAPPATGWSADIGEIRRVATLIPGRKPLRINVLKFAESRRTKNFSVKGEPATPSVQARTVFQVVYPDGYVMVDAGMDEPMHRQIGRGAEGEPYYPDQAQEVNKALRGARAIVFTHEHGDHITGVIRTPYLAELAPKTILTRPQVNTLENRPQFPDLQITEEQARRYHVIDYDRYMAFAPGWTLIKAAGHTPGSQMMFITVDSGREYLLIGDTAWHMDGIRKVTGKDAPWIVEDTAAVTDQLKWLNGLAMSERNLVIVASHDDDEHKELVAKKLLGGKLD